MSKILSSPYFNFVSFVFGIFLASTVFYIIRPLPPTNSDFKELRHQGNYKFINPLLECDDTDFSIDKNLVDLQHSIKQLINNGVNQKDVSFASVYYRDLNNGAWFGINENELFSPASLVKVPLMITYYKLSETNPEILKNTLVNKQVYNSSSQNIQPQVTLKPDTSYTVEDLIYRMVVYSDNLAYDLLLKNINNTLVVDTYRDLGIDISKGLTDPNGNIISVKDYASFFRILYNSSYLSKDSSEKALNLLTQISFKQGLNRQLPATVSVAHKFGERQYLDTGEKQFHDCGIVYLPTKPYLICIMTRSNDFPKAIDLISHVSLTIYSHFKDN